MANPVVSWAKENPLLAGGAAFAVVIVVMLATGGSSAPEGEASGGMGGAGVAAYYAAMSQQNQAGAAVQIAQIQANASTNKALIASSYGIEREKATLGIRNRQLDIQAMQIDQTTELQSKALDYWQAQANNNVNLENAKLTQQQNVAFKKINIMRPSPFSQILGAATQVGAAFATGGASVALPAMGSAGQWL